MTDLENSTFNARLAALAELAELKRITDILEQADIKHLVIKGAAVSISHYSSPHLRPHVDIDIWLENGARELGETLLTAMGYATDDDATPAWLQKQFSMRRWINPETEVVLDMHLKLANAHAFEDILEFSESYPEAKLIALDGVKFKTLSDVDALILACIHPVMHHYSGDHGHLYQDILPIFNGMPPASRESFHRKTRSLKISRLCGRSMEKAGCPSLDLEWWRFEPLAFYPYLARGFWGQIFADILLSPPSLFHLRRLIRSLFPTRAYIRRWAENNRQVRGGMLGSYLQRLLLGLGKSRG